MPFDRAVVSTPGSERMFSLFGVPDSAFLPSVTA